MSKTSFITSANNVFYNMNEYKHSFYLQANIISHIKCCLLRQEEIEDFYINGYDVLVYRNSNGYDLYYDEYCMNLEVYENMIVGMNLNHI